MVLHECNYFQSYYFPAVSRTSVGDVLPPSMELKVGSAVQKPVYLWSCSGYLVGISVCMACLNEWELSHLMTTHIL